MRSFALLALLGVFASALVPACAATPELKFTEDDGGSTADTGAPPTDGSTAHDAPSGTDGASEDATASDASADGGADGGLCGAIPITGIGACCAGGVACVDRQNQNNCASCVDCDKKKCNGLKVCCYSAAGQLDCKPLAGCN